MKTINDKENTIGCINCITGKEKEIVLQGNRIVNTSEMENVEEADLSIGPQLRI